MSAEVLREAAALMRSNASLAAEGPWESFMFADGSIFVERVGLDDDDLGAEVGCINRPGDADHMASWHPAVALAVADLLDQTARLHEHGSTGPLDMPAALAVATAYLGSAS